MGRSLRFRRAAAGDEASPSAQWWDEVAGNARAHGARPYVVEGFAEITEAVRRGHAVLVRREQAEVADGMTIFEAGSTPMTGAFGPAATDRAPIVAILRFDIGSARFVLQDAASPAGAVQLTPRRLARYLDAPDRSVGVALGA
jgi:hypothetical protein